MQEICASFWYQILQCVTSELAVFARLVVVVVVVDDDDG